MGLLDSIGSKTFGKVKSPNNFTTPSQIETHLKKNIEQSTFINVRFDDSPLVYSSTFVEISLDKPLGILIDTLVPTDGNIYIKHSKAVILSYMFEGEFFSFKSKFHEIVKTKFVVIKLMMPEVISKVEHRRHLRIKPPIDIPMIVFLDDGIQEEVVDISAGGLAFHTENTIREGKVFKNVIFALPPDNQKIRTKAIVRRFIKKPVSSKTVRNKCCLQFNDLGRSQTELIVEYVIKREREIFRGKLR